MIRLMVVVVWEARMCIVVKPSLHWSRCQTRIPKTKKSLYVIVGPLQVLPIQLLTTCLLTTALKEDVNYFDLRRSFYSKQVF